MNNNIDNDMINNAFECAEYLRDFCRIFDNCYGCPFCWIGDTGLDYHCSIGSIFCNPCDWDLVKCSL